MVDCQYRFRYFVYVFRSFGHPVFLTSNVLLACYILMYVFLPLFRCAVLRMCMITGHVVVLNFSRSLFKFRKLCL